MARGVGGREGAQTLLLVLVLLTFSLAKKFEGDDKPAWAKKDIRDYSDADLERLLDQWDVSWIYFGSCQSFS